MTTTDPHTTDHVPADGVKPFAAFLQEQRNGALHAELSEALQQLAARVMEHEKAGSLTLVIKIEPMTNGLNLIVHDDVKLKAPEAARPVALWYADAHGNVSRRDPRQPELPLQAVERKETA